MTFLKIFRTVLGLFTAQILIFSGHSDFARAGTLAATEPTLSQSKTERYKAAAQAYLEKNPEKKAALEQVPAANGTLSFVGSDGVTQTVTVMGRDWILEQMGAGLTHFADPANREKILKNLYGMLSDDQKKQLQIVSLDQLKAMSAVQAKSAIKNMADLITSGWSQIQPQNLASPPDCADEVGYENGSDCMYSNEATCGSGSWDADGLIAKQTFSLEKHLTCVKHQGERGTCAVFAVNAALEIEVSKQFGEKANLSEQHAYWYYKEKIEGADDQDDDGADPETLLEEAMSRGYEHQLESVWNYNPSWDRVTDADGNYDDSCVDYAGEYCTDTVHQGNAASSLADKTVLGAGTAEAPFSKSAAWSSAVVKGDGYVNRGVTELMDLDERDTSLSLAISYLDAGHPVIVTLHANTSFVTNPSAHHGFMQVSSSDQNSYGHAVLAAGYVSCSDMYPSSSTSTNLTDKNMMLSNACRIATGGGYFVIKNSWGVTYGDQGYVYIPYSWAKDWFYHLVALDEGLD